MYRKEIVYSRETRDYAMYLDGELVGFARTYHEAEVTLDQLVFELMSGQFYRETADAPTAPPAEDFIVSDAEAARLNQARLDAGWSDEGWNGYTDPETGLDADDYPDDEDAS